MFGSPGEASQRHHGPLHGEVFQEGSILKADLTHSAFWGNTYQHLKDCSLLCSHYSENTVADCELKGRWPRSHHRILKIQVPELWGQSATHMSGVEMQCFLNSVCV